MKISALLVDDHHIFREGLKSLLEQQRDIKVVAEAGQGREAVRLAGELCPDIVVMDVAMPDLNGIEATRQIIIANPQIKVIGLSMHSDHRYVMEMLKSGAAGYVLKESAFEELVQAIRNVRANQIFLSPKIAHMVIKDYVTRLKQGVRTVYSLLSTREREVLQLLAEGKSTKDIALALDISIKTVETHRQQIMDKLDIHNIAELTKYAVKEGLVSLET